MPRGEFIASFSVDTQCKAQNIEILAAVGIEETDAARILQEAYFTVNEEDRQAVPVHEGRVSFEIRVD